jgi:small subunit ribosomal protein S5
MLSLASSGNLIRRVVTPASVLVVPVIDSLSLRWFSDKKNPSSSFRPRRRAAKNYRPVEPGRSKAKTMRKKRLDLESGVSVGKIKPLNDDLDSQFGPLAGDLIRSARQEIANREFGEDPVEQDLRIADYMTAEFGSTEDLVAQRRAAFMESRSEEERVQFTEGLDALIEKGRAWTMDISETPVEEEWKEQTEFLGGLDEEQQAGDDKDPEIYMDKNQLAHGDWSEMLVTIDRNIKLWRGGRLESYRALVIGGNLNGCGGFGVGKALDPIIALDIASRKCKRNIFFVDRYKGTSLTRDVAGKQNSCKVILRATDNGLRGNELIREMLKRFGITNAVAKSHGNRNVYNVVRATFKALSTHESIEEIALKRGKRIVSIDRAMRMQV